VIRTRVGYTGGSLQNPTYHELGDHSEAIQIDFDPHRITYSDLLAIFWKAHKPFSRNWSRQYRNALFFHDEGQRAAAEKSRAAIAADKGRQVRTAVEPLGRFYRAEGYHQKYRLRSRPDFLRDLTRFYPMAEALTDSTAAARLNGYLGGHGNWPQLQREIDGLGLREETRRQLVALVQRRDS
jgi:peptide-methionine (S)-S-oxide reductase